MFKAADADTEGMKNSHINQDLPADDVHPPAGQPGSTDAVSVTIEEMEGVPEPRLSGRPQRKHRTVMQSFNKHEGTLKEIGGYLIIGAGIYGALLLALGNKIMLPVDGVGWAVFAIWACSHVAGYFATKVGMPALLGMLVSGLILTNSGGIELPHGWSVKIRSGGLAVILMRAGLKIDKNAFRTSAARIARLGTLPVLSEALFDFIIFYKVFNMPAGLAVTGGFILAAISPTVLVTGMLELQRRGFGSRKQIPSMEMAAAGIDTVVAITGFAIASGLAVPSGNAAWTGLHGPLSIIFGIAGTVFGGLLCSWTRLWGTTTRRTAAVLVTGLCFMYAGVKWNYLGASALGCFGMAVLISYLWELGKPAVLCKFPGPHLAKQTDDMIAVLWIILVQPMLFGTIGSEIDFRKIESGMLGKAFLLIFCGAFGVRAPMAALAIGPGHFTLKERAFIAMSWIPKATIQGALGGAPLDLINSLFKHHADYAQYVKWGEDIKNTAVLAIIITAPLGLLIIGLLGPIMLEKGETPPKPPPVVEVVEESSDSEDDP